MRRVLLLVPITSLFLLLTPAAGAVAAPMASSGERCTIVGTAGDDVLVGTRGRDVICGRGGNDTLRGGGGDDILDGGAGTDRLAGGVGNDQVQGGKGNDTVSGGAGNDRIRGGAGNDTANGGAGNDRVNGDVGGDRVNGGTGNDTVMGDAGPDTVAGGAGGDVLLGGNDPDTLLGQDGNDDLNGQGGSDSLDGGAGTNWCIVGAEDKQKACVYDKEAPKALAVEVVGASAIDVTDAPGRLTLRLHASDDTGIAYAGLHVDKGETAVSEHLVAGNVRDGWWETTVEIPRYAKPGTYGIQPFVTDRVGRRIDPPIRWENVYAVVNRTPDVTPPVVKALSISPVSIDVRTKAANVTVTAHITDDLSGPRWTQFLLHAPNGQGGYTDPITGASLKRVSGTANDGIYKATFPVPAKQPGGTWQAAVMVSDLADSGQRYYYGEDYYQWYTKKWGGGTDPLVTPIPGGTLNVLGTSPDTSPPQLLEVRVNTDTIDTLPGQAMVTIDMHIKDVGDGLQYLNLYAEGQGVQFIGSYSQLSGTANDGWYRTNLIFEQGTPPGDYVLQGIWLHDRFSYRGYGFSASPNAQYLTMVPASAVNVGGVAGWDGVITVVANPAG